MLRTIATSPEQSALHSAKLMKDLVPAGAMAEVLSFMLARYGARQDNASMGKVLDSVVAELCMPGRLKEKIQAYRPYVPADMQDEDIGSMVAKAYRSAADIAIAMAVYRNVPDPSQVAHAYALETNSKRPDGETRDYATMVSKTPQEYRDEAFRKFDTMFSSELRYARDTQENTLFALSALESIRQGKDPVTAVRLVYAPEPQSATAAAAPSGR